MSKEKVLTVQTAVRGFHVYKASWQPKENEKLSCDHEEDNKYDIFAIKVCQSVDDKIVGHLPIEISRITRYALARGAKVEAQLTQSHYRRSPLVQGGLEIPCSLTLKIPATKKSSGLLERYLELFESKYTEPQEIVILGTFNNEPTVTEKKETQPKKRKLTQDPTDIRTWFKPARVDSNDKPSVPKKIRKSADVVILD